MRLFVVYLFIGTCWLLTVLFTFNSIFYNYLTENRIGLIPIDNDKIDTENLKLLNIICITVSKNKAQVPASCLLGYWL